MKNLILQEARMNCESLAWLSNINSVGQGSKKLLGIPWGACFLWTVFILFSFYIIIMSSPWRPALGLSLTNFRLCY